MSADALFFSTKLLGFNRKNVLT